MRCDTKVKGRQVLAVHIGDAVSLMGSLQYTSEQINTALEEDCSLGISVKANIIREFHRGGSEVKRILKGPDSIRKRVTVIFLSSLPTTIANSLLQGNDFANIFPIYLPRILIYSYMPCD